MKRKRLFFTLLLALIVAVGAMAQQVRVTGTHVRLRLSPSLNGAILTNGYGQPIYPAKGTILNTTGYTSNGFVGVYYAGGSYWIYGQYVRRVNSRSSYSSVPSRVVITGDRVVLRFGPGKNYSTLTYGGQNTHLYRGDVLTCVGVKGDWWRVVYDGGYYYVSRIYARPY